MRQRGYWFQKILQVPPGDEPAHKDHCADGGAVSARESTLNDGVHHEGMCCPHPHHTACGRLHQIYQKPHVQWAPRLAGTIKKTRGTACANHHHMPTATGSHPPPRPLPLGLGSFGTPPGALFGPPILYKGTCGFRNPPNEHSRRTEAQRLLLSRTRRRVLSNSITDTVGSNRRLMRAICRRLCASPPPPPHEPHPQSVMVNPVADLH